MKPPWSSNQPQPTRNARVPAPPFNPVVSRSKKTNGIAADDRPTSEAAGDASSSLSANSTTRWRPWRSSGANRWLMTNERPDPVSRQAPPRDSRVRLKPDATFEGGPVATFEGGPDTTVEGGPDTTLEGGPDARSDVSSSEVESGFSRTAVPAATVGLAMPRRRSLSVEISMSSRQLVRQQHVEDPKRRRLGVRSSVSHRSHAGRAPVLALTLGNQPSSGLEKLVMHPKQRLAEPNAAGVVVVHEHARALSIHVERDADVLAIAHQQQLSHLLHRKRQPDDSVTTIVGGIRQSCRHGGRNRHPV